MEDQELVARALAGDTRSFTTLVRRHERSLYATAYAITRSQWDAADAVQDALAEAYVNLKSLRDPARFGAWVSRIVINTCNTALRRRGRVLPMEEPPEPQAFVWDGPEDGIDLMRAIQTLSPDHREVIALRYFRDLKVADIAEVLGTPAGTVKSRINRALAALQAALGRTGQEVSR
ncbi:MAG: sigma-70 family RNA polymerase sigma factor [Coriobacteriia bacterium]|nr:sigma-70 family RNA polymerase sigma factor [Coriobacteriia bacterium]